MQYFYNSTSLHQTWYNKYLEQFCKEYMNKVVACNSFSFHFLPFCTRSHQSPPFFLHWGLAQNSPRERMTLWSLKGFWYSCDKQLEKAIVYTFCKITWSSREQNIIYGYLHTLASILLLISNINRLSSSRVTDLGQAVQKWFRQSSWFPDGDLTLWCPHN